MTDIWKLALCFLVGRVIYDAVVWAVKRAIKASR
jgi:hypothetical protein